MTGVTLDAMNLLTELGVTIRNQAVLQRGVNDDLATMQCLTKRLGYLNIQPYYVFYHDLVAGVEDLRTTLSAGIRIEKGLRGTTSSIHESGIPGVCQRPPEPRTATRSSSGEASMTSRIARPKW